ncbi:hypothetical protein GUJ93_ZPchr0458g22580 [Zizania palustris]|uniref:Uncharacterized protein n=1 Tax=Zizania palustris TaxID=103762 RepID=A0A8J5R1Y7_ZIZPA|nr:hypothetical protein GUJ93_ZPchr0119g33237 [Zizania palustris]KAG8043616.1 hypothetical protein GUJ93_ZPchr0458g22580 [Zizania palustris]
MRQPVGACKAYRLQPAPSLLSPRPLLRRALLRLPAGRTWGELSRASGASSRLAVRRRCREEEQQQHQEEEGQSNGGGGDGEQERRTFLSLEEAGLVEMSGLSTHERFLCRLTISSLNLLRVISEQEGVAIEELNAGRVCDWFLKDKLKREQNVGSAVLQWDDPAF